MADVRRNPIIVLGMHRGGTSAVSGAAVRLGVAPPLTPVPAANDNAGGFYESLPVVYANYRILLAAGCAWNACLPFDPVRLHGLLTARDRQHLAATLRQEFGRADSRVLKDPRLCLTLPAWLPALLGDGSDVRVLLV